MCMNKYLYVFFLAFAHGNFDQVYACWEITDFVYKKMLGYCSRKSLIGKHSKKENTQIRKKIIGKLC